MSETSRTEPLVSVLMPVFNYGRFVSETVESIWRQTYPKIEIIAVDDGSTDDSLAILEDLASRSKVSMEVLQSEHVGVSGAMKIALTVARGEYVAVVHADDIHLSSKISRQVSALEGNKSASLVHCEYRCVDERGIDLLRSSRDSDLPAASGNCLREILELSSDVRSVSMLYRKASIEAMGGYEANLPYEDWQAILKLAFIGEIIHIDEELVLRRLHTYNSHINVTKFPKFNLDQIAPLVLDRVRPSDMERERLFTLHIGTIISSSIGSGNIGKGFVAVKAAARIGGFKNLGIVSRYTARGFMSLVWLRVIAPFLSPKFKRKIRKVKFH